MRPFQRILRIKYKPRTLPSQIAAGIRRLTFGTYADQTLALNFANTLPADPDASQIFQIFDVQVGGYRGI